MKTIALSVLGIAVSLSVIAEADDHKKVVAFNIPAEISSFACGNANAITFEHVQIDCSHTQPDYTFHAKKLGGGSGGFSVIAWLEPGMKEVDALKATCNRPECKIPAPSVETIWAVFNEALDKVLIENAKGFGQYIPQRCVAFMPPEPDATNLTSADVEVKSDLNTGLERSPRYRLMFRTRSIADVSFLYYKIERFPNKNFSVGRFIADPPNTRNSWYAMDTIRKFCNSNKIQTMMFVSQYSDPVYSQRTAQNASANK